MCWKSCLNHLGLFQRPWECRLTVSSKPICHDLFFRWKSCKLLHPGQQQLHSGLLIIELFKTCIALATRCQASKSRTLRGSCYECRTNKKLLHLDPKECITTTVKYCKKVLPSSAEANLKFSRVQKRLLHSLCQLCERNVDMKLSSPLPTPEKRR